MLHPIRIFLCDFRADLLISPYTRLKLSNWHVSHTSAAWTSERRGLIMSLSSSGRIRPYDVLLPEQTTHWHLALWRNQRTWYACGKMRSFSSPHLPLSSPLRPCFVLPVPESVAYFHSGGGLITHQPWSAKWPLRSSKWRFFSPFFNHSCLPSS